MSGITGTLSIRTRAKSDAAAIILDLDLAAAASDGKCLTKADPAITAPRLVLEGDDNRDIRRSRNVTATNNQIAYRRFSLAPAVRQPATDNGDDVVSYATDLILAGWIFVRRRKLGKNWLDADEEAKRSWGRVPGLNDVLAMLQKPSEYSLFKEGQCANKAWGDAKDALLRVFKRKPPENLEVFRHSDEGYMKFFFESLGPEELVLVSFHD